MRLLAAAIVIGLTSACGGTKNSAETEAPVQLKEAYYITEVAGTPGGGITNTYYFSLEGNMEGVEFDSVWMADTRLAVMQMKDRPLVQSRHSFRTNKE